MTKHRVTNPDRPVETPSVLPKDYTAGKDAGDRFADKINLMFPEYLNNKTNDFIVGFVDAFRDKIRTNTNGLKLRPPND